MMARKTKRGLSAAVDDLDGGDADPVAEWVDQHLRELDGAEVTYGAATGEEDERETDDGPEVCIWRSRGDNASEIWTSRSEIPDWIDLAALPVER